MQTIRDPTLPATACLEVADALYRFGAGVDRHDGALLATAFSDDAVVDFSPCGRKMGLDVPVLTGADSILGFLGATGEHQTTTHVVTNPRVAFDGEVATLQALVDATHRPKHDQARHCRMMNWYAAELVRPDGLWRMRRLVIESAWFTGDAQVLLGK